MLTDMNEAPALGAAPAVLDRPIGELIPYANNARTHSEEHIAQIAASLREGRTQSWLMVRPG